MSLVTTLYSVLAVLAGRSDEYDIHSSDIGTVCTLFKVKARGGPDKAHCSDKQ